MRASCSPEQRLVVHRPLGPSAAKTHVPGGCDHPRDVAFGRPDRFKDAHTPSEATGDRTSQSAACPVSVGGLHQVGLQDVDVVAVKEDVRTDGGGGEVATLDQHPPRAELVQLPGSPRGVLCRLDGPSLQTQKSLSN